MPCFLNSFMSVYDRLSRSCCTIAWSDQLMQDIIHTGKSCSMGLSTLDPYRLLAMLGRKNAMALPGYANNY